MIFCTRKQIKKAMLFIEDDACVKGSDIHTFLRNDTLTELDIDEWYSFLKRHLIKDPENINLKQLLRATLFDQILVDIRLVNMFIK